VNAFWQWFQQALGTPSPAQRQVYATVVVMDRRVVDARALYQWRKAIAYATAVFAFLVIGGIWFQGFQSVSTFLGLLSAGLAVALQDPIVNLAGWLFIVWRRPFDVGDRIQIGEHRGDVIDIRIFQFSLMEVGNWVEADQSTGRVIHIPNGKIFRETQANYSKGFQYIWNEIPVLVKKLHQAAKKFMIVFTRLTPAVFTSVADSGVLLTIRYLCEPKRRRVTTQEIWEAILEEFSQCDDIDFAYPTYRFYDNPVEGKSDARAPLPPATGPQGFVVKD
jgi:small-conductance mechanosensitive channel